MTMVLHWDERGTEVQVSTVADLDQELDRLALTASAAGGPVLVRVYDGDDPSGPMLTVGVGGTMSTIGWTDRDSISWMSQGESRDERPFTQFIYAGHVSEIPASAMVTNESARDAARRFVLSGERPDNVSWVTV